MRAFCTRQYLQYGYNINQPSPRGARNSSIMYEVDVFQSLFRTHVCIISYIIKKKYPCWVPVKHEITTVENDRKKHKQQTNKHLGGLVCSSCS